MTTQENPSSSQEPVSEAQAVPNPSADAPVDIAAAAQVEPSEVDLVAELQSKVSELNDQFLRARAEAENARRRADDEVAKARKFAVESFAESLLAVADSLEAALSVQQATPEQMREGVEATHKQLASALEKHRVVAIAPAQGDKFDPAQHQAISMVPADQPAQTVVTLLQKGYLIADRVLRPALVTVAAPQ